MKGKLYEELHRAILAYDAERAVELCSEALRVGCEPSEIINENLTRSMAEVGELFENERIFLPELLLAAETVKTAVKVLEPRLREAKASGGGSMLGKVVIGTVEGDIHDIGKDIVAAMLQGSGFEVCDIGKDAPAEKFTQKAAEFNANIVASSALISVTMAGQARVEEALEKAGLRRNVKTMVGGSPVTEEWRKEIGADGYAENAVEAVKVAKLLTREVGAPSKP